LNSNASTFSICALTAEGRAARANLDLNSFEPAQCIEKRAAMLGEKALRGAPTQTVRRGTSVAQEASAETTTAALELEVGTMALEAPNV
jgi:hypothetical protein